MQGTNDAASGGAGAQGGTDPSGLLTSPTSDSERFLADLKAFVTDAETLLHQARTLSGAGALAAREEFERRLAQARQSYAAAREMAVDRAQDYMDRTEAYVRNEPWKAIGVAAFVGALVGVLLSRR